ncbi:MAG: hypothetical protein ABIQ09_01325 [Jatrophihabitantaceae bacterium]
MPTKRLTPKVARFFIGQLQGLRVGRSLVIDVYPDNDRLQVESKRIEGCCTARSEVR